ncbi:MAG: MarR family transcriptional regulator [Anaerolineales bacterium]|nr:MarR family transcriptional regulator [Anaerolineales bacterium]
MNESISQLLIHVCRAHRRTAEFRLNEIGLYAGQEAILLHLIQHDGLSQTELAQALGVEAPTVTKSLARLVKAGYVRRQRDPVDGRIWRVYITPQGRKLEQAIRAIWTEIEAQVSSGLSDTEQIVVKRLLAQMLANLS